MDSTAQFVARYLTTQYCTRECHRIEVTSKTNVDLFGFQSISIPAMSIERYVLRFARKAQCSSASLVLAVIYLVQFERRYGHLLPINILTIHRLFQTAHRIATKFHDDNFIDNAAWAQIAGIKTLREMNQLEVNFLFLMDFDFRIQDQLFDEASDVMRASYAMPPSACAHPKTLLVVDPQLVFSALPGALPSALPSPCSFIVVRGFPIPEPGPKSKHWAKLGHLD